MRQRALPASIGGKREPHFVQNHKLELVNVVALGNFAYVASHFTATLVVNNEANPISGSTVRLVERQSDGEWR
jgi:hypothetical protein